MGGSLAATGPGLAQQTATSGQQPVVQLPEVSVEAPGKRNVPKQVLRQQTGPGNAVPVPGIVVEGEKVLRTHLGRAVPDEPLGRQQGSDRS